MLTGEYDEAANEVEVIRSEMDGDIVLKVIIESGALKTPDLIRKASLLVDVRRCRFRKDLDGQDRRRSDSRGGGRHVPGHPRLL